MLLAIDKSVQGSRFRRVIRDKDGNEVKTLLFDRDENKGSLEVSDSELAVCEDAIGNVLVLLGEHGKADYEATDKFVLEVATRKQDAGEELTPHQRTILEYSSQPEKGGEDLNLADLTVASLIDFAESENIDLGGATKKADIISAIESAMAEEIAG